MSIQCFVTNLNHRVECLNGQTEVTSHNGVSPQLDEGVSHCLAKDTALNFRLLITQWYYTGDALGVAISSHSRRGVCRQRAIGALRPLWTRPRSTRRDVRHN